MDFKPYGIDEMIELTANPDQEVELSYCDVKGNVLLEGGRPADGFSIAWSRQDEDSGFSDESKTNHSGDVFDVKLPPGTYELEFNHRVGLSYETFARKTLEIGAGESERELTIRQGEGF
ncbi:MAG: carboxypeptidase-like regulatory domain-containing protein [Verrucomicrobiota bacterium]